MDVEQSSQRRKIERSTLFIAGFAGLFLLFTFSGANEEVKQTISDIVGPMTAVGALIWSFWNLPARYQAFRKGEFKLCREGWSAALFSLSIASFGIAEGIWGYLDLVLHKDPFPSGADVCYVTSFVFLISGILTMPTRRMRTLARFRVMVDSFIVTTALVTFSWFFILGPTVMSGGGSSLAKVLGALYPLFDLAMLGCVMMLTMGSREPAYIRIRNLLAIGIGCYVASDVAFGYLSLHGTYTSGNPWDTGWILSNLVVAQATLCLSKQQSSALAKKDQTLEAPSPPKFWRMVLPYTFVPAVALLLAYIWHEDVDRPLALGVYISAGTLMALILIRQVLAIAENSHLYKYLQDAYRELEALATTDGMTGLPNHRLFQERLRAEIVTCRAQGTPVTLLLIDVDRFKSYNDNFGHPAGDEALRIVGRILRESVRGNDLPARYGGEEFAAILPSTASAQAYVVAERIRTACEAQAFPFRQVTLSIGIATTYEGEATELIERSDEALYAAKNGGRNRVEIETSGLINVPTESTGFSYPEGWSLQTSRAHGINLLTTSKEDADAHPAGPLLSALLAILSSHSRELEHHPDRVMHYCLRLAEQAAARGAISITSSQMADLHLGAILHDIGKLGVPEAILRKPGLLTDAEREVVHRHPIQGAEMLADIPSLAGALPIVRSHHERWDGTGYPDGLSGRAIPLGARIFALADTLDAMWSDRPYRRAMEYSAIRDEIRRSAGTKFDPSLVEAFLSIPRTEWERIRSEADWDESQNKAA
jgi:diguanylate cyclase (GGDEF)-like protein